MKLVSVELVNYCQFRHTHISFAPGLTAILGRNGSGKSNTIKAVYAAITGDFGRNDGLKTDNICQFAEAGAPSRITATIEHGDSTLTITRSLRPVATRLKVTAPGIEVPEIGKSQEATEYIANTLGVSARMLADYVFVDQWSIFDFLSMMPAERAKAFQRLFRTERAEAIWKQLGDYHDKIIIPTPGISKDLVLKRLIANREKYAILSRTLTEITGQEAAYDFSRLRQNIADHQRAQEIEKEIGTIRQRAENLDNEIATLKATVDRFREEYTALSEYVQSERESYISARTAIANWLQYDATEHNREQLRLAIAVLDSKLKETIAPTPPSDYVGSDNSQEMEKLQTLYAEAASEITRLKKLIDAIKGGVAVCELCGSKLVDSATAINTYENELRMFTLAKDMHGARIGKSRNYNRQLEAHKNWLSATKLRKEELEEQLQNLAAVARPEKSQEVLQSFIAQYEKMRTASEETLLYFNKAQLSCEGKVRVYEQLLFDLKDKQYQLDKIKSSITESSEVSERQLADYEAIHNKRLTLTADWSSLKQLISDDEMSLLQLETIEKEADAERAWAEYVLDLRHIFHRDSLPRLVAQNFLDLMEDEINNLLVRFGSTFSVCSDDTLSFAATFHDGRRVPAARLSGGEKVLLALAFRVAVNDIFAKDLGLLVLDEPTAGLDEGNLTCLRIAIERLKELSAARGLQVIMITHERDLHNLFDHVIELGKDQ